MVVDTIYLQKQDLVKLTEEDQKMLHLKFSLNYAEKETEVATANIISQLLKLLKEVAKKFTIMKQKELL